MKGNARIAMAAVATCLLVGDSTGSGSQHIDPAHTAVIVFTGDERRIAEGLDLYRRGMAAHIFVTGIDLKRSSYAGALNPGSFDIRAVNTGENGLAVRDWLQDKNISRIILVTSGFHMARSRTVLERTIDPRINITSHPVDGAVSTQVLRWEYLKRIATWLGLNRIPGVQLSI